LGSSSDDRECDVLNNGPVRAVLGDVATHQGSPLLAEQKMLVTKNNHSAIRAIPVTG
jgi:hypothetical protein